MASSVPAVLDYLVARIKTLADLAQLRPQVCDDWADHRGDAVVVVGGTPDNDEHSLLTSYAQLSGERHEDVTITSTIWVRRTGDQASSRARRDAYAIFDAIDNLVRGDDTLGGAITPGMPAQVGAVRMRPTPNAQTAGEGRVCDLRWQLSWQHRG